MRSTVVNKKELAERLFARFGYNEPIFTSEIISIWNEYERSRAFQIMKELCDDKILTKADTGIYYFSTQTFLGKPSVLGRKQVLDKRFICYGGEVYGYYSGLTLQNWLGITPQMPFKIEVVSSRSSAIVREVKIFESTVTVRKSRVPVNKENVYILMLLEVFCEQNGPYYSDETEKLPRFTKQYNVTFEDVKRYADYFPKRAMKNIIATGIQNIFAK